MIMATAEQIKALLCSYTGESEDRFLSVAMQIGPCRANRGHPIESMEWITGETGRQQSHRRVSGDWLVERASSTAKVEPTFPLRPNRFH